MTNFFVASEEHDLEQHSPSLLCGSDFLSPALIFFSPADFCIFCVTRSLKKKKHIPPATYQPLLAQLNSLSSRERFSGPAGSAWLRLPHAGRF